MQAAAIELIAAMRAVLDIAEEAVREPEGVRDIIAATARAMAQVATPWINEAGPDPRDTRAAQPGSQSRGPSSAPPDRNPGARTRVEHIKIL